MGVENVPQVLVKSAPGGCLPVPHDDLLHYSRCLKYGEREKFVQHAPEQLRGQIGHLLSRVQHVRSEIDERPDGEFWTSKLADHMADFRSKPQPKKTERSLAATLSRLHIASRNNVPEVRLNDKTLAPPNIAEILATRDSEAYQDAKANPYKGLQAGAVYFKNGEPHSHPSAEGSFPNQTTPLVDLLSKDGGKSLLSEKCEEGTLRWFHIPSNNMIWVEEAIARHFNEDRPQRDELFDRSTKSSKTHEILRRVGWRGHSREGVDPHSPPHTRQLNPGCEVIKTARGDTNAMCLFAPYLHWETEVGWTRQNKSIEKSMRHAVLQQASAMDELDRVEDNFHHELQTHNVNNTSLSSVAKEAIVSSTNHMRSMTTRANTRRGVVGRILFCAARIAKLMVSFEDDELVGKYLYANPPLHPRRTLHQSLNQYSTFLRDTERLDQEQIVYKATAGLKDPTRQKCSKYCQCSDCSTARATVPRLLMVDQLWVFVLDENTVITSFPQRWGSYFTGDPSGVHTRIRQQLDIERDEISNSYDLVLKIFNVCSRVFYESIKFADRQPMLNYIFSDSLNFVTTRELAARQELAHLAQTILTAYHSPDKAQIAEAHKAVMNINPEAGLLRQTDNILSDLTIIRQIKSTQQEVLKQFHINAARLLVPNYGIKAGFEPYSPGLRDVKHMREALRNDQNVSEETKSVASWTLSCADDSEMFLADQYRQIDRLYTAAEHCHKRLGELLDTKNRYAGIVGAWEAVANSIEQSNQGKSIMLFSVLSIIFLPLSFITSIFGMNIQDYRIGLGTLAEELYYVFGISVVVIFISLLLAFDKFSLALLLYCFKVPTKWVMTRIALLWQPASSGSRTRNYRKLNEMRVRKIREMEEEIQRVRLVRDTKLFWKSIEAEQAKRRAQGMAGTGNQKRVESSYVV
ncbi:magnesium transport protein cora [Podospora australis]|uniref:Magnesium transport protein cora n=1 Tax=Podospora australis TaxID=1536484 RepID=A0AAN7AFV3_9PEZI|nr:magnesium transport protein cora [Podospora australis]